MDLQKIREITQLAIVRCEIQKQDIDVYEAPDNTIKFALSYLNNTGKHINKLSYEKGSVVVRDDTGKVIFPVEENKANAVVEETPAEQGGENKATEIEGTASKKSKGTKVI
jgi:hypothetical protein